MGISRGGEAYMTFVTKQYELKPVIISKSLLILIGEVNQINLHRRQVTDMTYNANTVQRTLFAVRCNTYRIFRGRNQFGCKDFERLLSKLQKRFKSLLRGELPAHAGVTQQANPWDKQLNPADH